MEVILHHKVLRSKRKLLWYKFDCRSRLLVDEVGLNQMKFLSKRLSWASVIDEIVFFSVWPVHFAFPPTRWNIIQYTEIHKNILANS